MFKKLLITLALYPSVLMAADTMFVVNPIFQTVGIGQHFQIGNCALEGALHATPDFIGAFAVTANAVIEIPLSQDIQPRIFVGGVLLEEKGGGGSSDPWKAVGFGARINMYNGDYLLLDISWPAFFSLSYNLAGTSGE